MRHGHRWIGAPSTTTTTAVQNYRDYRQTPHTIYCGWKSQSIDPSRDLMWLTIDMNGLASRSTVVVRITAIYRFYASTNSLSSTTIFTCRHASCPHAIVVDKKLSIYFFVCLLSPITSTSIETPSTIYSCRQHCISIDISPRRLFALNIVYISTSVSSRPFGQGNRPLVVDVSIVQGVLGTQLSPSATYKLWCCFMYGETTRAK